MYINLNMRLISIYEINSSVIYPKFKSENEIIHKIIQVLQTKNLKSDDINEIFENKGRKEFRAERVSTMGKLSELQIVNWKINQEGKSIYSLNKEKLKFFE